MDDSASSTPSATSPADPADVFAAATQRVQDTILSLTRHGITWLAGLGTLLALHGAVPSTSASAIDTAGANAGPIIFSFLAVVLARLLITWLGKKAPGLVTFLGSSGKPGGLGGGAPALLLLFCIGAASLLCSSCAAFNASGVTGALTVDASGHVAGSATLPIKDSTGATVGAVSVTESDGSKPSVSISLGAPVVVTGATTTSPAVDPASGK